MKKIHSYALFSLLVLSTFVVAAPSSHADDCQPLLKLKYPDVAIYEATSIAEPVPHCKAKGLIGGNINFSVWLPTAWNGRFVMGGAGGFGVGAAGGGAGAAAAPPLPRRPFFAPPPVAASSAAFFF